MPARPFVVVAKQEAVTIIGGMDTTSPVMQFDTLDYARKLETAGVPGPQAEAQAKALGDVLGRAVAYRGDLMTLENSLSSRLAAVESRLDAKIDSVANELTNRIDTVKTEVSTRIDTVKTELATRIDTVKTELATRIDTVKTELATRIETLKNELQLDLGGKIETLKWMFGALVALNVGILIRLLALH
jgi:gas vesicle protein